MCLDAHVPSLLHAFDGALKHAARGAAGGLVFSIPPCVVRSPELQRLAAGLPLGALALETDAPALAPERGALNIPANVAVSAAEVARLRGLRLEEVVAATAARARALFPRL
jgi:TatD DNase family protein